MELRPGCVRELVELPVSPGHQRPLPHVTRTYARWTRSVLPRSKHAPRSRVPVELDTHPDTRTWRPRSAAHAEPACEEHRAHWCHDRVRRRTADLHELDALRDLAGPWRELLVAASGLAFVGTYETLSAVYHALKWTLPPAVALAVAPVADLPKAKGLAPGTNSWLKARLRCRPPPRSARVQCGGTDAPDTSLGPRCRPGSRSMRGTVAALGSREGSSTGAPSPRGGAPRGR